MKEQIPKIFISREEAWTLFKKYCVTAHEDWTPYFFVTEFINKHYPNVRIK